VDEEVLGALQAAYADRSWGRYDGPHSIRLIDKLRELHGVEHVLLCSAGTIAVELALRGLKVGPGDEVVLAAYDFAGNFRAVEAVGARPVLADLAERTWTLDADLLREALGPRTKAIIVSHLHGALADMPRIVELASAANVAIVEDACQTPGAIVGGKIAGNWGDVGIYSFGGSKLLTAGRGGAIVTPQADVAQRIRIYSQRGNEAFPLSELQAAVLIPQVARLKERNQKRAAAAERLVARLANTPQLAGPVQRSPDRPAYYKLGLFFRPTCQAPDRELAVQLRARFIAAAQAEGIAIDEGFRGFAGRSTGRCRSVGSLARAREAAQATLLLHHPVLLEPPETIDRLTSAIIKVAAALADEAHSAPS
jgi:dTDP-4-amino-4,6-dideoxygalactose transaminase